MTNSLIKVLNNIIEKKLMSKSKVVADKQLVISKKQNITIKNLGKLSS